MMTMAISSQSFVFFDPFVTWEPKPPAVKPPNKKVRRGVLLNHFLLTYSLLGVGIVVAVFLAFKLIQIWFAWERKNAEVKDLQQVRQTESGGCGRGVVGVSS